MTSLLSLIWALVCALFFFSLMQTWSFVALLALFEIIWVGLVALYALLGVYTLNLALVFWGFSWLIFSSVELVTGASLFVAYQQVAGAKFTS